MLNKKELKEKEFRRLEEKKRDLILKSSEALRNYDLESYAFYSQQIGFLNNRIRNYHYKEWYYRGFREKDLAKKIREEKIQRKFKQIKNYED